MPFSAHLPRAAVRVSASAMLAAAILPLAAAPAAHADPPGEYSLAATVSPPPLTVAECAADPGCAVAPAPAGGGQDDYAALRQAVDAAGARTVPAVVDAAGVVITPPTTATVLLPAGTYTLTKGLRLPPNVNLRGAGIAATTLVMDPSKDWRNFNYGFLIRHNDVKQAGSANLVSDLTVNGNCRPGAGAPTPADLPGRPNEDCDFRSALGAPSTVGGGVSVGDRWTVRQVRFTNLEYFKLWVHGSKDARIVDNRFDNWGGAESGDEDNIGGGGRNDGTVIEHNQFDKTIRGNSFDFTNAIRTTVRDNVVLTEPAVAAARGQTEYGNMYFEGIVAATVTGNVLRGAHITLQSNGRYEHTGNNKDVTNPRDSLVAGNRVVDSATGGIVVIYEDYRDADNSWGTPGGWDSHSSDPADHVVRPGGGNVVRDNTIERPRRSGVLVLGSAEHAKDAPDTITGNTVRNAGYGGATSYNTGAGYVDTAGIGLSIGAGDRIYANTIVDDQATPTTWYGVHIGARKAPTRPTGTVLADPAGQAPPNTATGIIGYLYRHAANAPEAPAGLAPTGPATLSWNESYPLAGLPIGGYKVYRDGRPVADLPIGSPGVPGNLLTDAEGSFETDTAGWTAGTRTTIARNPNAGAIGSASLALTSTGAGQISAYSRQLPAAAATTYTSVASFQAAGAGRRVRAGIAFTLANGAVSRLASANTATVDAATGWMTSSYTSQAPAGTVAAQAFLMVENTVPGEVHYLDRAGLVTGTATEQWSDPAPPAGPATYHVLAYHAGTGEHSGATTTTIP